MSKTQKNNNQKNYKRNQPSKSKLKFAIKPKFETSKPQRDTRNQNREGQSLSKVYGVNACLAYAKNKSSKILRAFFTKEVAPKFSELMKSLAAQKKVYRIVITDELEKVSQSQHHEGVCFNVEADEPLKLSDWFKRQKQNKQSCLIALENVGNPHNLGAIMRVGAHFGVDGIAMTNSKALQSGAAKRTAEGGAEFVEIVECESMKAMIVAAKKEGYSIVTTSSHNGKSLYKTEFPSKCILFFGEEGPGLTKEIMSAGNLSIQIPGTQNVESLNVSSAISIILGEVWRQQNRGLEILAKTVKK